MRGETNSSQMWHYHHSVIKFNDKQTHIHCFDVHAANCGKKSFHEKSSFVECQRSKLQTMFSIMATINPNEFVCSSNSKVVLSSSELFNSRKCDCLCDIVKTYRDSSSNPYLLLVNTCAALYSFKKCASKARFS